MLRILHLEDSPADAFFVDKTLRANGLVATISVAKNQQEFRFALENRQFDLILVDQTVPGFGAAGALEMVQSRSPGVPVICVSGSANEEQARAMLAAGASNYVLKDHLWQLVGIVRAEAEKQRLSAQLQAANRELEIFSYAASHDLSAPLRTLRCCSEKLLKEQSYKLDHEGKDWLTHIHKASVQMGALLDDLLRLSRFSNAALKPESFNLGELAQEILSDLAAGSPGHTVHWRIAPGTDVIADKGLVRTALENLLSNAWKYSANQQQPLIEVGSQAQPDGSVRFFIRDNGPGFDMQHAEKLFQPFQRLHSETEFAGSGVGLATVQRIIERHGGRIWAHAAVHQGATFFFTLGSQRETDLSAPTEREPKPFNDTRRILSEAQRTGTTVCVAATRMHAEGVADVGL
jgi:two-component system sensor histidine kinase/response regulator